MNLGPCRSRRAGTMHSDCSLLLQLQDVLNRRTFLARSAAGLGVAALGSLLPGIAQGDASADGGLGGFPHHLAKAKRVIYLFQSGAPSQMELFDHKPTL